MSVIWPKWSETKDTCSQVSLFPSFVIYIISIYLFQNSISSVYPLHDNIFLLDIKLDFSCLKGNLLLLWTLVFLLKHAKQLLYCMWCLRSFMVCSPYQTLCLWRSVAYYPFIYYYKILDRIVESQGWKGPTRSSSPTVLPLPLLPQATEPYLIAPHPDASWTLPGMATPAPPWAAIPVPDRSLREKGFPYV